jgi:hypothetical protein
LQKSPYSAGRITARPSTHRKHNDRNHDRPTIEVNMIKKVTGGYKVLSEKGKNLGGPYKSKAAAQKRLRQVEYFKHKD